MSVTPPVTSTWRRVDCPACAAGDYLTDGMRLLRVVARFDSRPEHEFAVLEDCYTLEVDIFTREDLGALDLRVVSRRSSASRC